MTQVFSSDFAEFISNECKLMKLGYNYYYYYYQTDPSIDSQVVKLYIHLIVNQRQSNDYF